MDINAIDRVGPAVIDTGKVAMERAPLTEFISPVLAANRAELFGHDRELIFVQDDKTHVPVIAIRDRNTGEVLEEIPPKKLREMLQSLRQRKHQGEDQ